MSDDERKKKKIRRVKKKAIASQKRRARASAVQSIVSAATGHGQLASEIFKEMTESSSGGEHSGEGIAIRPAIREAIKLSGTKKFKPVWRKLEEWTEKQPWIYEVGGKQYKIFVKDNMLCQRSMDGAKDGSHDNAYSTVCKKTSQINSE